MAERLIFLVLSCSVISLLLSVDQSRLATASQQTSRNSDNQITVTGCVSRMNTQFVLIESTRNNTYQLEADKKFKLGSYLGHEVEITGVESNSISNSAGRIASPVMITVRAIKAVNERCSSN